MRRHLAATMAAVYAAAVAALTLGRPPGHVFRWLTVEAHRVDGLGFLTVSDVERILNVAFFVPAGFLLCLLLPRTSRWRVWLVCVLASVSVEAVQFFLPARDASVVDVLMNATGAAIGVLLHGLLCRRERQPGAS